MYSDREQHKDTQHSVDSRNSSNNQFPELRTPALSNWGRTLPLREAPLYNDDTHNQQNDDSEMH